LTPFSARSFSAPLHLFLHSQCGVQSSLRVILVRHRRAEQREDSISRRLRDVAVVAMDRLYHQLERRIHDRTRLFRVEIFDQFHRPLDVREQHRHRLPLAFEIFRRGRLSYLNR